MMNGWVWIARSVGLWIFFSFSDILKWCGKVLRDAAILPEKRLKWRLFVLATMLCTDDGRTTTATTVLRPFVRDYPGEPVPEETLTHPPSWSSSSLYQLLPSTTIHSASSLFKLRAWQSFCTTSLHVLFGLPLGLEPSTSHSVISSDDGSTE